jgi:hypothetical protein
MISAEVVSRAIDRLSLMPFFPPQSSWPALVEVISEMCSTDEQIEWLSRRMLQLHDRWPGPHELRAVLCSKYKPADGIKANSRHPSYIHGYPYEPGSLPSTPKWFNTPAGPIVKFEKDGVRYSSEGTSSDYVYIPPWELSRLGHIDPPDEDEKEDGLKLKKGDENGTATGNRKRLLDSTAAGPERDGAQGSVSALARIERQSGTART